MRRAASASVAAAAVALTLAGCATVPPDPYLGEPIARHLERNDDIGYCARLFADIDRRVDVLGVRDAEAPRIVGFPYLRVDRFTAQPNSPAPEQCPLLGSPSVAFVDQD